MFEEDELIIFPIVHLSIKKSPEDNKRLLLWKTRLKEKTHPRFQKKRGARSKMYFSHGRRLVF